MNPAAISFERIQGRVGRARGEDLGVGEVFFSGGVAYSGGIVTGAGVDGSG